MAARVNFLPNIVQRWLIKCLLENHHYSHFGVKMLTEKPHYVLLFFFSLMLLQAEVMLRLFPLLSEGSTSGPVSDNIQIVGTVQTQEKESTIIRV